LHRLRGDAAAEGGRLLRVLLIRLGSVPTHPGPAFWPDRRIALLRGIAVMASDTVDSSRDWLRSPRTTVLAWWIPQGAIFITLFLPASLRTITWIFALIWMGTACTYLR
jgi:hypothetical protein